ncbi:hypothetical protein CWI42_010440 [Ordospora colligata]|uniref:Uncharacterized protein n=1 Tax=Ordospora colligata OC4 TaxID=1354746 RepID=A0A0B2UMV1_9MICR|nr:uncharacterized protein M896_010440 [Ordospora colligata OC4]KHN70392.1 hypothetical protein M896_010440 [Ordospora colligata OC4]TBU17142.1 hypothetical protein CWI41_010440 [Ordospora colligata]TBU17392.1 hypothetical protein CWI40_010440 [Ordospora colligata]TBU19572.1 hypothetical protein CWI42_010440 [Ordospora colligata]
MKELVDVLYYDHILSKLANLYTLDSRSDEIVQYQKIAQKILIKLRADKIVFDAEVGLKFVYVKMYDLHFSFSKCAGRLHVSCCPNHYLKFVKTSYDYLMKISLEYKCLTEHTGFNKLIYVIAMAALMNSVTYEQFIMISKADHNAATIGSCLEKHGIKIIRKEDFEEKKVKAFRTMGIEMKNETEHLNKSFQLIMDELKKIYLSFGFPLLQFFTTNEMIKQKGANQDELKGIEGIPNDADSYKQSIIKEYMNMKAALNKTRSIFINPKDNGEKIGWGPESDLHN